MNGAESLCAENIGLKDIAQSRRGKLIMHYMPTFAFSAAPLQVSAHAPQRKRLYKWEIQHHAERQLIWIHIVVLQLITMMWGVQFETTDFCLEIGNFQQICLDPFLSLN